MIQSMPSKMRLITFTMIVKTSPWIVHIYPTEKPPMNKPQSSSNPKNTTTHTPHATHKPDTKSTHVPQLEITSHEALCTKPDHSRLHLPKPIETWVRRPSRCCKAIPKEYSKKSHRQNITKKYKTHWTSHQQSQWYHTTAPHQCILLKTQLSTKGKNA